MKKSVGRRKRLPHQDVNHCTSMWGRRFRLPTGNLSDFFTASETETAGVGAPSATPEPQPERLNLVGS